MLVVVVVCWLPTSQQHANVSQGQICSGNWTCCHTEIEIEDQTCYLTQSQCTNTRPTSPSADPILPDAWQGSHWITDVLNHWYDWTQQNPHMAIVGIEPRSAALKTDTFTTRPVRQTGE